MSIGRFRSVLAGLGPDPTPREVAEILWLATRLPAVDASTVADARTNGDPPEPEETAHPAAGPARGEETSTRPAGVPVHPATTTSPLHGTCLPASPVRLAADSRLPGRLELLRAMQPLKRRVPSRHAGELDEEATTEEMAQRAASRRNAAHHPVLRPAAERWLDAVLVVDGHPTSLLLWTSLAREVHRMLIQLGAFRDVRIRYLHAHPDGPPGLSAHPVPDPDRIRGTSEICDPTGRRLVLVLTDGVSPAWHDESVRKAVRQWAAAGPLAVLQALPEHLWRRTALPVVPARLRRSALSAANTDLAYTGHWRRTRRLPADSIPVPVLELNPQWLRPWANLVAGSGHRVTDAGVTLLAERPQPRPISADTRSPARRLQDFHATAAPDAFRLAAYLSAVPLSFAIMRVVHAAMLPGSPPAVLAEVMFSGLITPSGTDDAADLSDIPHDFLPGVRAALLETLRVHEVDRVLLEVSRFLEHSSQGPAGRVSGLLPALPGPARLPVDGIPWARLREEALVRAGLAPPAASAVPTATGASGHAGANPYTLVTFLTAADFSDVFIGVDAQGTQAVVKTQPYSFQPGPEVFREFLHVEAESLRRMAGQDAPPLLGMDAHASPPWLAMGYITSVSGEAANNLFRAPWWSNGPPDNFHSLAHLARQLARILGRAHSLGIVHGNLSPHAVVLVPDTPILISWVYAQHDGRPHPCPQYRELATGYLPPEGYPQDEPLDPSFDIYGLGAILLHEATRDSPPRSRGHLMASQLPRHLGDLGELIRRCMAAEPTRRPTARALMDELEGIQERTLPPATVLRSRGLRATNPAFGGDRHLLFLPGGEPQAGDPHQLRMSWVAGLNLGLNRAGHDPIGSADVSFSSYRERLEAAAVADSSPWEASGPDGTYQGMLMETAAELGVQLEHDDRASNRKGAYGRLRQARDRILSRSGPDSSAILPVLRTLARYLSDQAVRDSVLEAVLEVVPRSGRLALVAHGMGALVAMDLINHLPVDSPALSLVTLGSPLGLSTVRRRFERPAHGRIRRWTDVRCREDLLTTAEPLHTVWPGEVENLVVDIRSGPPGITDYLAHPAVAGSILAGLA
ncbi:SAV_2336 N-terminal domain-related protein [Streptomyces sp. NPDC005283]|uniref:SAV_2336 N-terminal domain-related protein n=1 Tax=Streptomyces sp. NPDC005283 TaxID=3156871 RepID=UPI0034556900